MRSFRFCPKRAIIAATIVIAAGCSDFSSSPEISGGITISAIDQDSTGVAGLTVELLMADRITVLQTVQTGPDGTVVVAATEENVIPQPRHVRLHPGPGHLLAAGEMNDKRVTSVVGAMAFVTFGLVTR